jgi:hypothetical protein
VLERLVPLLCVQKSVSKNPLDIIWRQELPGHFDIIGNMKQIGPTDFGK